MSFIFIYSLSNSQTWWWRKVMWKYACFKDRAVASFSDPSPLIHRGIFLPSRNGNGDCFQSLLLVIISPVDKLRVITGQWPWKHHPHPLEHLCFLICGPRLSSEVRYLGGYWGCGTSLVVQRLRRQLPAPGVQAQSLVGELRSPMLGAPPQ